MKTPRFLTPFLICLLAGCATKKPVEPTRAVAPEVLPTTSPGTQFALLPSAVQRTITAQAGAAEIQEIKKIPNPGRDAYEITFANPRLDRTLQVAEDGTLLNSADQGAAAQGGVGTNVAGGSDIVRSLPYPVQRTLAEQAPGATVAEVQRQQRTVYEISLTDPALKPLVIAEDGSLLQEAQPK